MLKILVTGDNHIGKKYDRYPQMKELLVNSRFEALQNMVQKAEEEGCSIFAVTGDLFDNVNTVKASDVKRVVEILAKFNGTVLILPGNHDYYTGEDKVWKEFEKALTLQEHNIILLNRFEEYAFEAGEERVIVYPAFCHAKHSQENNLTWIKKAQIEKSDAYHIGIAHGALKGITPDKKEEYFLMNEKELLDIPVDVWLLGHTHISYPQLTQTPEVTQYRVFNPGTHEQTDLHNNTEGCCFLLTIDKTISGTQVSACKYVSGKIRYYNLQLEGKVSSEVGLQKALEDLTGQLQSHAIVRVRLSGTVNAEDYQEKDKIYQKVFDRFLAYECIDSELSEEITIEKIRSEYSELSFAAQWLEMLMDNPVELQMAYALLQECKQ